MIIDLIDTIHRGRTVYLDHGELPPSTPPELDQVAGQLDRVAARLDVAVVLHLAELLLLVRLLLSVA